MQRSTETLRAFIQAKWVAAGREMLAAADASLPRRITIPRPNRRAIACAVMCWLAAAAPLFADDDGDFSARLADESAAQTLEEQLDVEVLEEGVSSRRLRRSAADELPLARLTPEGRRLADQVLDELSLHRKLPVVRCEVDPRVMQFFMQHPDVAVGLWRAMDISEMQLRRIAPNRYRTDGGDGSAGTISVLINDRHQQLIHCEGMFKSPVLSRAIDASALMWLRVDFQKDEAGREFATSRAEVFVAFPSGTVEAAARVASPVTNRIADRNFHEVAMFVRMMHLAMTRQPGWVEQLAHVMTEVEPQRVQELIDATAEVYLEAQRKLARAEQKTWTPEGLRLPIVREPEAATAVTVNAPTSADSVPKKSAAAEEETVKR